MGRIRHGVWMATDDCPDVGAELLGRGLVAASRYRCGRTERYRGM
jgi:hypothetical protein